MTPWSRNRVDAAIAFIRGRLHADFAGTGVQVEFKVDPSWGQEGTTTRDGSSDVDPKHVIVVCGGHEFPLGLESGIEVACADATNALQDDVMDLIGRPWPELLDADSNYVDVASPASAGQVAYWQVKGEPFCAVGQLHEAVRAAGLSIKGHPVVGS
jgi:hypothetical protein